jgi:hypothetical protein
MGAHAVRADNRDRAHSTSRICPTAVGCPLHSSGVYYRCHTGFIRRCAGPIKHLRHTALPGCGRANPCGTFIESRTGGQAMATLPCRVFGLAALGILYTRVATGSSDASLRLKVFTSVGGEHRTWFPVVAW